MSRRPRTILFATEYYPPFAPGGAEWTTAAWAGALVRRGWRVDVVTPNYGAARFEDRGGVRIHRVPLPLPLRAGQGEAPWLAHRNPIFHAYFGWHVWRRATLERAEVIHAQNKGALVAAWLAGRASGRPVVVTIRDVGLLCPLGMCTLFETREVFDCTLTEYVGRCVPFFRRHYGEPGVGLLRDAARRLALAIAWADLRVRQAALRRTAGVVGVSARVLGLYPERLVPPDRRRVVHSLPPAAAVDTADAGDARHALGIPAGPLVLYAGKLSLGKGTPVLLAALDAIRAAVPGVQFVFAGKGGLALPRTPDVHALGAVEQRRLFGLYRDADVVVQPAVWPEPLSRVLLEAMRFGRPVVASDAGGNAEIVEHGVTGLVVPRNDPAALADGVIALLRDPARRIAMGRAAEKRAAEVFDEDALVEELAAAYDAVALRR